MNIALVLEHFDPARGGLEQWTVRLAEGLLARGHRLDVVARSVGHQQRALPARLSLLPHTHSGPSFAAAAQQRLLQLNPDVIHDMGAGWFCDVLQPHTGSRWAMQEQKVAMLPPLLRPWKRAADRLLPRWHRWNQLLRHQLIDDGRLLIAISQRVADDLHHRHHVPRHRLRLVHNGVDTRRFSPAGRDQWRASTRRALGLSDNDLLALIVTHNFQLKGVPSLLDALGRQLTHQPTDRRPNTSGQQSAPVVKLAVVGGKSLGPWQRRIARRGLADRVRFVGPVTDPRPFYAAADFYVHPTFYDACSLVVLEALACGLPVVTTRQNGVSELITDGLEGYLLDRAGDHLALSERLQWLGDQSRRTAMGVAARRLAEQHTFERNIDRIVVVYEEIHGRRQAMGARDRGVPISGSSAGSGRQGRPRSVDRHSNNRGVA